jgi:hypothetical protein
VSCGGRSESLGYAYTPSSYCRAGQTPWLCETYLRSYLRPTSSSRTWQRLDSVFLEILAVYYAVRRVPAPPPPLRDRAVRWKGLRVAGATGSAYRAVLTARGRSWKVPPCSCRGALQLAKTPDAGVCMNGTNKVSTIVNRTLFEKHHE